MIGSRIGPYEVLAKLGEGGMGEVYRARDSKLKREVALKVLPADVANDRERLARFQREAEVLAALNHPNIAQIYGLENPPEGEHRTDSVALVMELVEGEDLAERVRRGPIPLEEALPIAKQIAEALEAAHEAGIIHRDLKPANVKVRPDGTVKVLDFGLAKALQDPNTPSSHDLSASPTITSPAMTMRGVILGTAAYMAPEQAKGKRVDKRADIWAFGCVLYEMLTGRRPFAGDDISDTLAFVLTKDVDWNALPATTPRGVHTLLRHCLQKSPNARLRDIGDARLFLAGDGIREDLAARAATPSRVAKLPWAIAAAAGLTAAALGIRLAQTPPPTATGPTRFVIAPSAGELITHALISRDGSFLVFQSGSSLFVRQLAEFEARPIAGTEGAQDPFLSPDDRWVGFFHDGKMKRVALAGGDPLVIAAIDRDIPGAAWVARDRILFTPAWTGTPMMSVSPESGAITAASTLDVAQKERGHWWPEPLPDGRHVLFTIWYAGAGLAESRIGVLDLETGRHRPLFPGAFARYAAGHIIYQHAGVYQAARFDPDAHSIVGEPRVVLSDAIAMSPTGTNNKTIAMTANGTIAYVAGELYPELRLSWMSRNGRREDTQLSVRANSAELSPDGTRLAYGRPSGGASQVVIVDLATRREQRLQAIGYTFDPVWHPDGRRIAFISMRNGDFDVRVESTSGGPDVAILNDSADEEILAFLPGGETAIVRIWDTKGGNALFLFDVGSKQRSRLTEGPFEVGGVWPSPDGRWLAMCATPTGTWQLYVRALAGKGALEPVGTCPMERGLAWSPVSQELVFARGADLVALSYAVREGQFTALREQAIPVGLDSELVGIGPDGRFLIGTRTSAVQAGIRVMVGGLPALMSP